jgi:hypothetical protein
VKYQNLRINIIIIGLFSIIGFQDYAWEKKYQEQTKEAQHIVAKKNDSLIELNKIIDSLSSEIFIKSIDIGRYEFIMGELEQEPCCKRFLENLQTE